MLELERVVFFQFMKQKKKGNKQRSFSAWLFEQIRIKIINKKVSGTIPFGTHGWQLGLQTLH